MQKEPDKDNKYDLEKRLIDFAVRIMNLVETLPNTRAGNHIAGQLIRCGTSPAPNYGEAQSKVLNLGVTSFIKLRSFLKNSEKQKFGSRLSIKRTW